MKALVGAFNQEKALVGAFSMIVKTDCGTDGSFYSTSQDQTLRQQEENCTETDFSSVMSSQATVGRVRVAGPQSMLGLGTITVTVSGRGAVLGRL